MTLFQPMKTQRLYMRELTLADRESVFKHFADEDVTRFILNQIGGSYEVHFPFIIDTISQFYSGGLIYY